MWTLRVRFPQGDVQTVTLPGAPGATPAMYRQAVEPYGYTILSQEETTSGPPVANATAAAVLTPTPLTQVPSVTSSPAGVVAAATAAQVLKPALPNYTGEKPGQYFDANFGSYFSIAGLSGSYVNYATGERLLGGQPAYSNPATQALYAQNVLSGALNQEPIAPANSKATPAPKTIVTAAAGVLTAAVVAAKFLL